VRSRSLLESIEWIRERSNVETIVVDSNPQLSLLDDHILSTYRLDPRALTWRGCDLEERIREIEADVEALRTKGAVSCFKVPNAYSRTLRIDKPSPSQARKAAVKEGPKRSSKEQKGVEDYLFRHFFERAAHWGMPVEIHTGFGWAIGERPLRLSEADPENLLPILEDPLYQPTTFILFHGGYPFTSKMGYIAGSFPNVYLDFTCLCPESWRMLKRSLHEWIDIVPMDRIVTGSDGSYEWLYIGAKLNRECLAEVLAEKVQDEYMGLDLALEVGRRILYANANSVLHYG
jgi:predicted TIM-barrel fold metal-dependent hydrolase